MDTAPAEMWDLRDRDGQPQGRTWRRADPLPAGAFHAVAVIATLDTAGRLLLSRRSPVKDHAGLWEMQGGSVLAGEDEASGAARELREETGIEVEPADLVPLGGPVLLPEDPALYCCFLARLGEARPTPVPQASETEAFAWVDLREADRREAAGLLTPADAGLYRALRPAFVAGGAVEHDR